MKIGPVDSGNRPHKPEEDIRRKTDSNSDSQRDMNRTDKVEISSVARSLSEKKTQTSQIADETGAVDNADAENRADKIERAAKRIESGYYDSPQVREEIARRIADDFIG